MTTGIGDEVAWWCPSLDDSGNGTTTLNDLVGSNDGTLTNMDAGSDWVADTGEGGVRALDFDGSNDFVSIGASVVPTGSNEKTVCLWFKTSGSVSTRQWFFYAGAEAGYGRFCLELESSQVAFNYFSGAAYHSATINADTWYHVAVRYDGGTSVDVFVDGVKETIGLAASTPLNTGTTTTTRLGSFNGAAIFLQGRLDDVRVFDRELTDDEIEHLASGRGVLGDGSSLTGEVVATLAACEVVAAGVLTVSGSVDKTLDDCTIVAAENLQSLASVVATLADATIAAEANSLELFGELRITLADAAIAATGGASINGQLAVTLGDATINSIGASPILAQSSLTLADAAIAATGFVGTAQVAELAVTLADCTIVATSQLDIVGEVSLVLADASVAAVGTNAAIGAVAVTLANATAGTTGIVRPKQRNRGLFPSNLFLESHFVG